MRHLMIVALVLVTLITQAQTFTPKTSSGGGFNVESGIATSETFSVDSKTFDVFETKSGSKYVKAVSKAGKEYPVWLGGETTHNYEGQPIRQFKSGTYAYFVLSSSGYPRAIYLDMN